MGELSRNNDALRLSYCSFILFFFVFDECDFEKEVCSKGRESGNELERRRKEKGKRGMRREKGEKELVWCFLFLSVIVHYVMRVGEKRIGKKKNGEKEGGGWKRVSGHRGLWLVTHLLCGGLGVSPHPPLSPPPLVLCLVLSFSCPLPFPPCVCE